MRQILLSVIIPTYNSADLLLRCLQSLEEQKFYKSTFEVIIVNDGSTDNTLQILTDYKQQSDLNLKIVDIPHSGPAMARNAGVAHAQTDWIAFLDADVIVSSFWIQRGITLITHYPEKGGFEGRTETCNKEKINPFTHQTINEQGGRYPTCNLILRKSLCHFYPIWW